jgi:hypothetical protein
MAQLIKVVQGGPRGDPGPPGSGSASFVHSSGSLSTWVIPHGLGYFPNATVIGIGGNEVEGEINHVDNNTMNILFDSPVAGTAYLS